MMETAIIQVDTGPPPGKHEPVVPFNEAGEGDFKEALYAAQAESSPEATEGFDNPPGNKEEIPGEVVEGETPPEGSEIKDNPTEEELEIPGETDGLASETVGSEANTQLASPGLSLPVLADGLDRIPAIPGQGGNAVSSGVLTLGASLEAAAHDGKGQPVLAGAKSIETTAPLSDESLTLAVDGSDTEVEEILNSELKKRALAETAAKEANPQGKSLDARPTGSELSALIGDVTSESYFPAQSPASSQARAAQNTAVSGQNGSHASQGLMSELHDAAGGDNDLEQDTNDSIKQEQIANITRSGEGFDEESADLVDLLRRSMDAQRGEKNLSPTEKGAPHISEEAGPENIAPLMNRGEDGPVTPSSALPDAATPVTETTSTGRSQPGAALREPKMPEIFSQVVENAKINWKENGGEIRISLTPPELGSLRIKLVVEGDRVNALILAQNTKVGEMLGSQTADLRQSFLQQGLHLDDISVAVGGEAMGWNETLGQSDPEGNGDGAEYPENEWADEQEIQDLSTSIQAGLSGPSSKVNVFA
jgi:flagellar hook-length control protein FliK